MEPLRVNEAITGGEAIARMLLAMDAGDMFGMGGFQLLPFYDAARRLGLKHHLINDERCAVFIADAYAKTTGRVGFCDATLGPGATNLLTGLVEALNAGSPLIAIVGDTHRAHSWKNMTQETRQAEMLRPACKEFIRVEMIERIPELLRRALDVATSGRPGPVVVAVPEDIAHATHPFAAEDLRIAARSCKVPALRCLPQRDELKAAADLLARARRPLLLCGGGVHLSGAAQAISRLATQANIPCAHTMSGKGAVPCIAEQNAGLFGRYDRIANALIEEADCLFVVGCKLGEIATKRYTLPPAGTPLIHLDIVAEEFGRTVEPTIRLWGDARETVEEMLSLLSGMGDAGAAMRAAYVGDVARRMAVWRDSVRDKLNSDERPISMARLIHELNCVLPEDALLVADGGFAAHWSGLLYDVKRVGRGFIPNRGFASIGYGLPGAMGVALGRPSAPVVALTGDGGFNMAIGELETAVRLKLPITIIVINNAASGYVKALQHLMYGPGAYQSSDLMEMNYAQIAGTLGCHGIRVEEPCALSGAISEALAVADRPTIIDVVVTRDPAGMLPGVDSRTRQVRAGDRIA